MPIVEWDGKTLKEFKGELDGDQHQQKQKGLGKWSDLLGGEKNPDIAVDKSGRLFVRLRVNQKKAEQDDRTIYEDGGKYWGEL